MLRCWPQASLEPRKTSKPLSPPPWWGGVGVGGYSPAQRLPSSRHPDLRTTLPIKGRGNTPHRHPACPRPDRGAAQSASPEDIALDETFRSPVFARAGKPEGDADFILRRCFFSMHKHLRMIDADKREVYCCRNNKSTYCETPRKRYNYRS
jgi:hypothetical protein